MKKWNQMGWLLAVLCIISPTTHASVEGSRVIHDAVQTLTQSFVKEIKRSKKNLGRTAILISVSDEIDPDMKAFVRKNLESSLQKTKVVEVVQCFQCDSLRAHSDGNRIVIEKGLTNSEVTAKIARELSLDTFLDVNLGYSGKKIYLQVKAIDTAKQSIVWNENYERYARFVTNKGFTMGLDVGPAYITSSAPNNEKFGLSVSAFLGERFYGFGKVGVGLTSVFSLSNPSFNQSTGPYVSVNLNEVTGRSWSWGDLSVFVNPGYAVSQKSISFLMRGGLELGLGHFTHVAAEYQTPLYSTDDDKKYPSSIVFTIGYDFF